VLNTPEITWPSLALALGAGILLAVAPAIALSRPRRLIVGVDPAAIAALPDGALPRWWVLWLQSALFIALTIASAWVSGAAAQAWFVPALLVPVALIASRLDAATQRIPNWVVLAGVVLWLLASAGSIVGLTDPIRGLNALGFGAAAGTVSFVLILLVGMGKVGMGDVKLAGVLGAGLGTQLALIAVEPWSIMTLAVAPLLISVWLVLAFLLAVLARAIPALVRGRGREHFALGPFLVVGWLATLAVVPMVLILTGVPIAAVAR